MRAKLKRRLLDNNITLDCVTPSSFESWMGHAMPLDLCAKAASLREPQTPKRNP